MILTFTQLHSESGSVTGDGIDWFWSGRDFQGNEDEVQYLGDMFIEALIKEWPELNKDSVYDVPAVGEFEYAENSKAKVKSIRLNFEFTKEAVWEQESVKEEIGDYFSEPVEFAEKFVVGTNTAKVGERTFEFQIDKDTL